MSKTQRHTQLAQARAMLRLQTARLKAAKAILRTANRLKDSGMKSQAFRMMNRARAQLTRTMIETRILLAA